MKTFPFLKDVLACSLSAFGGPEAHFGVFLDTLVVKQRYVSEEDLVQLLALCSILPGPTSTQTIIAVGHKLGGPRLALFTMVVWALPAVLIMTILSFLPQTLSFFNISDGSLRYLGPLALGFIILAAFRIGRKVITDRLTGIIFLSTTLLVMLNRSPWLFLFVLVLGGGLSILESVVRSILSQPGEEKDRPRLDLLIPVQLNPPWHYLILFGTLALGLLGANQLVDHGLVNLAESFYRYGYLVFGGGQVVVPFMHSELVELQNAMTTQEFLTGYGLVQGLPGPMFSFAAYAGGLAARSLGMAGQILGALISGVAIFLPGVLLIFFVYPVWDQIKNQPIITLALKGIGATAAGMITATALVLLTLELGNWEFYGAVLVILGLLVSRKIPPPLLVVGAVVAGIVV